MHAPGRGSLHFAAPVAATVGGRDESGMDIICQTDRPKGSDTLMVRPHPNPDI
jgi:hypothetical protein